MDYEVYFSGASSTKTSATHAKPSLQLDPESLEAQLDRLNSTLAGLLHNDSKDFCDSFSFKDSNEAENSILSSYLLTEPNEKNPEHVQMVCEDFRSHELRSSQKNTQKLSFSCQLIDLYNIYSDLSTAIEMIEKGLSKTVQLDIMGISVKMMVDGGFVMPGKGKIFEGFCGKSGGDGRAYVKQLENEVEELKFKLFRCGKSGEMDELMFKSFNDSFVATEEKLTGTGCKVCRGSATQTSLEIQTRLASSLNNARKQMLTDLDWEVSSVKMLKSLYESKEHDLGVKEKKLAKQIQEINSEVQKKCKSLEQEKIRFLREQEKHKVHSQSLKNLIAEIKAELNVLKEKIAKPEPQPLTIQIPTPCITPRITPNLTPNLTPILTPKNQTEDSEDPNTIEQEISILESELLTSSDKNSIQFKINKLKTKLSTLRSTKILNTCTNKKRISSFVKPRDLTSTTPKIGTVFNFNIPVEDFKFTPKAPTFNYNSAAISAIHSPLSTIKPVEDFVKEESLFKLLELKEARLRKKEEEIIKQEVKMQQSWMKLPSANEFIPIVRNELERYLGMNERLGKSQAELDLLIKEQLEVKKNWKEENEGKLKSMEKLEERIKDAEKIGEILERIQKVLS